MKIFFDTSPLDRLHGGIAVYTISLMKAILTLSPEDIFYTGIKTISIKKWQEYKRNMKYLFADDVHLLWKFFPGRWTFPEHSLLHKLSVLNTNKFDVVHITNNICFPWNQVSTLHNVVLTIHDVLPFYNKFPILQTAQYEYVKKNLVHQAHLCAHIITVSQFSKKEICRITGVAEEKVSVVYNGLNEEIFINPKSHCLDKYKLITKKYFLAVGSFYPHKNYRNLVKAFDLYMKSPHYKGEKLVIVGQVYPFETDQKFIKYCLNHPGIYILEDVSDIELSELYQNAAGFFQISFLEGFGITLLEAMRAGCPACYTRESAMDEFAAGCAIAVDSTNVTEIMECMNNFSLYYDNFAEMVCRGRKKAEEYNWKNAAKQTIEVYRNVIARNNQIKR